MHGQTLDSTAGADRTDPSRRTRRHDRGPHALVALAAFAALVAGAVVVITLLVGVARLVQAAA